MRRLENNGLERGIKLFQGRIAWLKYGFDGSIVFVVMETACNIILGRFILTENEIPVTSIIQKYIVSVVIGFFFGTGPLQMMKRHPKNAEITWVRFTAYFFLIGVIEAVCVLCFIFFCENDIVKPLPLSFYALFFPITNYFYGVILFILKWRKTNKKD